uniref:Uncharacterized protein n=1 Tax=Aegilops tauschii subsp. strangulata TaxID=200361 RepID=A0A453TEF9_AEGTS
MSLYIFPGCRKCLHVQVSGVWIKISARGVFDLIAGACDRNWSQENMIAWTLEAIRDAEIRGLQPAAMVDKVF